MVTVFRDTKSKSGRRDMWDMDPTTDRATPHQIEQSILRWKRVPGSRTAANTGMYGTSLGSGPGLRNALKESENDAKLHAGIQNDDHNDRLQELEMQVSTLEKNGTILQQQLDYKDKALAQCSSALQSLGIELPKNGRQVGKRKLEELQRQFAVNKELETQLDTTKGQLATAKSASSELQAKLFAAEKAVKAAKTGTAAPLAVTVTPVSSDTSLADSKKDQKQNLEAADLKSKHDSSIGSFSVFDILSKHQDLEEKRQDLRHKDAELTHKHMLAVVAAIQGGAENAEGSGSNKKSKKSGWDCVIC